MTKEEYESILAESLNNFSDRTYENLLRDTLSRVKQAYDKRDGSMIYNAIAALCFEIAMLYGALDFTFDATYIHTAPREYLIKRAADRSIEPHPATSAIYYADIDRADPVPEGTRFSVEDLNFVIIPFSDGSLRKEVTMDGEETPTKERQLVKCETAGIVGNSYGGGTMIPIDYVDGLGKATLCSSDLYEDGKDEEETEAFRARVIEAMRSIAFGGNIADYKEKVLELEGIGQVKVHPVWNVDGVTPSVLSDADGIAYARTALGELFESEGKDYLTALVDLAEAGKLTLGGTVKLVVASTNPADPEPTTEKIEEVKELIDPVAGEGYGLAPIGHVVTVSGVTPKAVDVDMEVTLKSGKTTSQVETAAAPVIEEYFESLVEKWADTGSESLSILPSVISYKVLDDPTCASLIASIDSIVITVDTAAEAWANVPLSTDEVPVAGDLTITESD